MTEQHPGDEPGHEAPRSRIKDFLQLHLTLVVVLALCTTMTIIEARRASEGVDRALAYAFQWPLIGVFAFVVWNHYRRHGKLTRWFSDRYRARIEAFQRSDDAATPSLSDDPEVIAWREHVRELRRVDPPGGPPGAKAR